MDGKRTRVILAVAAATMASLISAASASATLTRSNIFSFGKEGTESSTFSQPNGIAFYQASKRLYVTSTSPEGIYGFDASTPGTFTPLAGFNPLSTANPGAGRLAVDNTGGAGQDGNVYMTSTNTEKLYGFDSSGIALAGFNGAEGIDPAVSPGEPSGSPKYLCGAAVDPSGNVWIGNSSTTSLIEYSSSGNYLKSINTSALGSNDRPCQMAFDTNGDMYLQVLGNGVAEVLKVTAPEYSLAASTKIDPHEAGPSYPTAIAVDPANHHVIISHSGAVTEYDSSGNLLLEFGGTLTNSSFTGIAVNATTNEVYVGDYGKVRVFGPPVIVPTVMAEEPSNVERTAMDAEGHVDPAGGGDVTECMLEWAPAAQFGGFEPYSPSRTIACANSLPITGAEGISAHITGLTAQKRYHYRFKVVNANGVNYSNAEEVASANAVTNVQTEEATEVLLATATLHGSFESEGIPTEWWFEYGVGFNFGQPAYGTKTPVTPASSDSVIASITGLEGMKTYHYRLVARNSYGTTYGPDQTLFTAQGAEVSNTQFVSDVSTDTALLHFGIWPNGLETTYRVEYGPEDCASGSCQALEDLVQGPALGLKELTFRLEGLSPGSRYHYRVSAENARGSDISTVDHYFTTFGPPVFSESCSNSLARQQTGSEFLLDCRAYELVSAKDTGGYSVESNLIPGQQPYGGFPEASGPPRVLYGIHDGGIPGTGSPTNNGVDPYVATRGSEGWQTSYVGIPAAGTPSAGPFSSSVLGADSTLTDFAFGGANICDPCFADGSRGIPVRAPGGELIQGMEGSLPVADPEPSGEVTAPFSADGSHLVFGSDQQFEPGGNPNDGNVTIYSRNLVEGGTEVVSTDSTGATLSDGSGVAELGISGDGSHVLIGDLVREEAGIKYWHLYMHIAGRPASLDLTPETASGGPVTGAVYSGMTADGSTVFFTTRDQMTEDDEDTSIDLYRAAVGQSSVQIARVSTGEAGKGNTDTCNPAGDSYNPEQWNSAPGAPSDCSVVAVGGGGGVASAAGSVYFFSPETLDGSGVEGAPNLFLAGPGGVPKYVTTLESGATSPLAEPVHSYVRTSGSFVGPAGVAIDDQTGSYYVLDNNGAVFAPGAYVQKFDSEGHIDTNYGVNGKIDGSESPSGAFTQYAPLGPSEIAVDNHEGSPSYGDLYVPDLVHQVIDKFGADGTYAGQISIPGFPSGVTVDQSTGDVYVTTIGSSVYVYDSSGSLINTLEISPGFSEGGIAVASTGDIYIVNGAETKKYDSAGTLIGTFDSNPSYGVAVDPVDGHVYVDEGNQVVEFQPNGTAVTTTGSGTLGSSISLGVDGGRLVVSNQAGHDAVEYGPAAVAPDPSYDSALVIDSVREPETRHTEDFQVTPDGANSVFPSARQLADFDPGKHEELYRYNAPSGALDCVSCTITNAKAMGDATMSAHGLDISNDGRVFFTTTEPLVLRDTDGRKDVYEWSDGQQQLISSGASPFDSGLLTASANGVDVYFFTHDTLAKEDTNGSVTKIYDAREDGGFFVLPEPPQCAASDECHGAGTKAANPPAVSSIAGTPAQFQPKGKGCPRGYVKRHGNCVKRKRHARHRHHGLGHHRGNGHGRKHNGGPRHG